MTFPPNTILERAEHIKLLIFDVDGVLTDGSIIIGDNGEEYKTFNARDGHGMKLLQFTGVKIGIITGRTCQAVSHRMTSLGIDLLYQGQQMKMPAFEAMLTQLSLTPQQCAYVGDDWVDLSIMEKVGLAVAVADAAPLVREKADWITPSRGGRGAAREVCECIMHAQNTLVDQIERHYAT